MLFRSRLGARGHDGARSGLAQRGSGGPGLRAHDRRLRRHSSRSPGNDPGAADDRGGAEAARANIVAIVHDIQTAGVTGYNGIAKALMARGIKTVTGSTTWQGNMVARLLAA